MSLPRFSIDPSLKERAACVSLGLLLLEMDRSASASALHEHFANCLAKETKARLEALPPSEWKNVSEARAALKLLGADPGRHRVSSEALARRLRQGKDLPQINALVDFNNVLSVVSGLPCGSYDLSRIESDVSLAVGGRDETYEGIGKGSVPLQGIPVLCDGKGPFGSPVSDSRRCLVTEETTAAVLVLYCFSMPPALDEAMSLASCLLPLVSGLRLASQDIVP